VTILALTTFVAVSLGLVLHWWPLLPARWRRRLAIVTNAAGVAFLVAAMRAEGLRESALTSVVVVGPATHTATASASASLYYYVLTAACLSLGFAGLAFGEPLARRLAAHPLLNCVLVAWLVTLVRLLLEKSAAPTLLAQSVGVTSMAPVAGAYLALHLGRESGGWRALLRTLLAYAFAVRGLVALVGVLATRRGFGTHYDVSPLTSVPLALSGTVYSFLPGSPSQVLWLTLLPQLVVWPSFTLLAGLAGGWLALRLTAPLAASRPTGTAGDGGSSRELEGTRSR
jgi:hypothetical protein